MPKKEPVFALAVEGCPMFFASGVLVSNCDAHQYACMHADHGGLGGGLFSRQGRKEVKSVQYVY